MERKPSSAEIRARLEQVKREKEELERAKVQLSQTMRSSRDRLSSSPQLSVSPLLSASPASTAASPQLLQQQQAKERLEQLKREKMELDQAKQELAKKQETIRRMSTSHVSLSVSSPSISPPLSSSSSSSSLPDPHRRGSVPAVVSIPGGKNVLAEEKQRKSSAPSLPSTKEATSVSSPAVLERITSSPSIPSPQEEERQRRKASEEAERWQRELREEAERRAEEERKKLEEEKRKQVEQERDRDDDDEQAQRELEEMARQAAEDLARERAQEAEELEESTLAERAKAALRALEESAQIPELTVQETDDSERYEEDSGQSEETDHDTEDEEADRLALEKPLKELEEALIAMKAEIDKKSDSAILRYCGISTRKAIEMVSLRKDSEFAGSVQSLVVDLNKSMMSLIQGNYANCEEAVDVIDCTLRVLKSGTL